MVRSKINILIIDYKKTLILLQRVIRGLLNMLEYIPGFRSGKKFKMFISTIYYILTLLMFTGGFGYGLFFLAAPFLGFSFIDIFKHKKRSMSLKKPLLSFVVSLLILSIAVVMIPNVESTSVSGTDKTQVAEVTQKPTDEPTQTLEPSIDRADKSNEVLLGGVTEEPTNIQEQNIVTEPSGKPSEKLTEDPPKSVTNPTSIPINTNSRFEVHFIDVGQGDASLVLCDGESMLIDGGTSKSSNVIYTYLKKQSIDKLNYIVSTHPHEDHVGGLAGALNYATVDTVFSPVTSYESTAFNNFLKYLNIQNVSITVPKAGETFKLGSATVQILGPVRYDNDVNNNSIVLRITYGDTSFLFTGDAEREEEQDILEQGYDLDTTVLKVGHHGGETSTTYLFLREVMPEYAVISVGRNNQYGHPHENTLSRLRDADIKTYRTDMQGDIICTSNGKTVSFTVMRNENANTLSPVSKLTPTPAPTGKPTVTTMPHATATPTVKPTQAPANSNTGSHNKDTDIKYILNTSTKKFHYPTCHSVGRMSENNKQEWLHTRDELINQGYEPCGNCKP